MKHTISKRYTFEAAHRLGCGYKGKCTNNHGHSFVVDIVIGATELNSLGMVIDFSDLHSLKEWIDLSLDHATILMKGDTLATLLEKENHKIFLTDGNPTSENIATLIFQKAEALFNDTRVAVESVTVHETCTSAATISR